MLKENLDWSLSLLDYDRSLKTGSRELDSARVVCLSHILRVLDECDSVVSEGSHMAPVTTVGGDPAFLRFKFKAPFSVSEFRLFWDERGEYTVSKYSADLTLRPHPDSARFYQG